MRAIVVDDEPMMLKSFLRLSSGIEDLQVLSTFEAPEDAIEFVKKNSVEIAFLDIEMRGMNGLSLGDKLLSLYPEINLIYTTGYSEYAVEAIGMRCSGYVLKPANEDLLKAELDDLRHPCTGKEGKRSFQASAIPWRIAGRRRSMPGL